MLIAKSKNRGVVVEGERAHELGHEYEEERLRCVRTLTKTKNTVRC